MSPDDPRLEPVDGDLHGPTPDFRIRYYASDAGLIRGIRYWVSRRLPGSRGSQYLYLDGEVGGLDRRRLDSEIYTTLEGARERLARYLEGAADCEDYE